MGRKKYTAALIGCGRIGYSLGNDKKREQPASHTMALNANRRINLVAACDTDQTRLIHGQEANKKAVVYSDSATLYSRTKTDIVTIAVNENAHMREAIDAIRSKPKLVILEKPVALNLREAERIREESVEYGVPVLINHERRFAADFIAAKKYMSRIGELQSIRAELCSSLCVYNPLEERTGAYSLIHDGTHLVDAVLFFLEDDGTPSDVKKIPYQKKGRSFFSEDDSSDSLRTEFKTVNSILHDPIVTGIYRDEKNNVRQMSAHYATEKCPDVSITMSGRSRFFSFEICINGTEGRICIGNGYLKFYHREKSRLYSGFYSLRRDKKGKAPKKTLYFANMVKNAVDYLDGKAALRSNLQTGINALAILEEIKEVLKVAK